MESLEETGPEVVNESITKSGQFIIAIGASAGGMEAIHTLFDNTPSDAVSYVIIQHLSPDHKSFMAELLAAHSKLKIYVAEDGMEIRPDCVYVLPEGKTMTIRDCTLFLKDRQSLALNSAIDIFFSSLAEDQGNKSIAIVLAGNGADGTKGIAAIKKVGGMVIVQDPVSTEHNSMPQQAISSGNYDYILPPNLIPQQIINYIRQRVLTGNFSDLISHKDDAALQEVIDLIKNHTPLDFSEYKRPTIIRRIIRRMIATNTNTISDYIRLLKSLPAEIDILAKEFLISVTKFFRDQEAFDIMQKTVIPEIIRSKLLVDTLKVWVIGCATGEEAYSLAILIKEHLTEIKRDMEVKIFASDIDKDALAVASKGIYPASIANEVSPERLSKYFTADGGMYKVKESIRNMLIIALHDITKNPPYYKLDLITCRNLLIYLNPLLQKKIFATLHYCLNLNGYLFLGPSETIGELKSKFMEEDKKWKIYKNIETAGLLENGIYTAPNFNIPPPVKVTPLVRSSKPTEIDGLYQIIAETLSVKTNHAGVCIDEHYKIINTFGDYKKYLLPEMFNFNLLEVLPHELSIVTSTAINRVIREKKELTIKEVIFMQNGSPRSIDIFIKPLSQNKAMDKVILVCFTEQPLESLIENSEIFNKDLYLNNYLSDVEEELKESQKNLSDAYEAIETSNAYAQSYNEELISGNEELQSTNEEVQSVNEELHTINNQYQLKIKELGEVNDDLNNYFRSTVNGHIFVDRNFIIRKFTPSAVKQVNLKESDIGRPLSDISSNIKFSNIIKDLRTAVSSSHTLIREIETNDGKWYQMVLLPYLRQQDSKSDGVIISFNDITDLKLAQKHLMKINEEHNTFIFSVSHDLNAPISNIEGLVMILTDLIGTDDDQTKKMISLINTSIKKLKETIEDLSDIPKIEKECFDEIHETVNINDLFEETKLTLREMLLKSNTQITVDFKEPSIPFSKKNLRSILLNLLTNAIKYKSPLRDPQIHISTKKSGKFILLSVQDNGRGISAEDKDKVFSMFKRVQEEKEIAGSGIGLYLIKKIIINAGGKIKVESEKDKGSIFKVWCKA